MVGAGLRLCLQKGAKLAAKFFDSSFSFGQEARIKRHGHRSLISLFDRKAFERVSGLSQDLMLKLAECDRRKGVCGCGIASRAIDPASVCGNREHFEALQALHGNSGLMDLDAEFFSNPGQARLEVAERDDLQNRVVIPIRDDLKRVEGQLLVGGLRRRGVVCALKTQGLMKLKESLGLRRIKTKCRSQAPDEGGSDRSLRAQDFGKVGGV